MFKYIRSLIASYKQRQATKARIKALKKRDPFIYK